MKYPKQIQNKIESLNVVIVYKCFFQTLSFDYSVKDVTYYTGLSRYIVHLNIEWLYKNKLIKKSNLIKNTQMWICANVNILKEE